MAEFLACDVVLAQTRFSITTPIAACLCALRGNRICVVEHGAGPLRAGRLFGVISMFYEVLVTAFLKCFSPRFFAVSTASARWLGRFHISNVTVLPNGIAPRSEAPSRTPGTKKTTIFYAGRLLAEKGVSELVDGVELFAQHGNDVELRIAGKGPLSAMLEERSSRSSVLVYLGGISPNRVACELDQASVFVNPSNLAEGFPTILLEAGSAALPVISTPYGGSSELIRDGQTGWIIPRGEAGCIASCLQEVVSSPEEAQRRGSELFRLIQDRYTWPSIVRKFLDDDEAASSL